MIYVFLDIDGVLNTSDDWKTKFTINEHCLKEFGDFCRLLSNKYSEVRIVFSSSWRAGLLNKGKTDTKLDRLLEIPGVNFYGKTPMSSNKTRQEEIEYYIRRNEVEMCIVIDDDASLFPVPSRLNIIFTNCSTGFALSNSVKKEVKKCLH